MDIKTGDKSKFKVKWTVSPYDYSPDKVKNIASKFSKKYGVPYENIKVEPVFKLINENGSEVALTNDVIANIQNPDFQLELFKEYMKLNGFSEDELFEQIKEIDASINSSIDYDSFDKFRKYSIKWVKWSNFLSYGANNFFDFSDLKGLVLLNGQPANQSGKTTFAIDLLHFLLFGKTSKATTLDKIFNRHLPEETEAYVEGCVVIDNIQYIIKRTLSRPKLVKRTSKSKVTQKVEYYKILENGEQEQLYDDVEVLNCENNTLTNKAIKEVIGKESDFDLIMSVTEDNLDDLVKQKETERGKMLSRWIGLLPIEQKDIIARSTFNSDIKPYLLSNMYNEETLNNEIEAFKIEIKKLQDNIEVLKKDNISVDKDYKEYDSQKKAFLSSMQQIDKDLSSIDISTLNMQIGASIEQGKRKVQEMKDTESEIEKLDDVEFSIDDFNQKNKELSDWNSKKSICAERYRSLKETSDQLTKSEYCPTCGRKLDGVDNTAKIAKIEKEIEQVVEEGKKAKAEVVRLTEEITKLSEKHELYQRRSKLMVKKSALEVSIEKLRAEYTELSSKKKEYEKNKEAIENNNRLSIQVNNLEAKMNGLRSKRENNLNEITRNNEGINSHTKSIEERIKCISDLQKEAIKLKSWKLYLEMVGKNGISKMVLRKALPIINANLSRLLADVCDFDVEVIITDKNDVEFRIIKDGVSADLSSGSGFEKTASALALRAVLASMSTLPRLNFVVFDEILGRVAKENYDNMRNLYEKILNEYDFIMQISHLDEIKDWHDTTITVTKENNVSTLQVIRK